MGSVVCTLTPSYNANLAKRSASKGPKRNNICAQYVNDTQVYSFSPDPDEVLSVNLMAIVDHHICAKQEFARTSSDELPRLASQPVFSSLELDACGKDLCFENLFETANKFPRSGLYSDKFQH
jgi:hypothetical protein